MKEWPCKTLGELCSLITDGKHGDCQNQEESGYYFISCKDVKDGRINYGRARQITHSDFAETHRRTDLKPGNILLTNSGTIGRLAITPDEERTSRTTLQKSVAVLKPLTDKITPQFLYYVLASDRNRLINSAGGAAQKNLLLRELRRFPIGIPHISIQNEITSVLSTYDDLIENNRRRIQLLEQSARLLYKEWFVHLRFPGHEHVEVADGVPKGWEKKPLVEVGFLNYGKALRADNRVPGPYPVYGSSGVVGQHNKALVKGPGIIVGRKGNVGSVYWSDLDFYPIDTVYFIDSDSSSFYLYYALLNTQFINTDVAVPGLNRNLAHSKEILCPPKRMKDLFEKTVLPIRSQIATLKNHIESLAQARDLLLPRLMNGEITL